MCESRARLGLIEMARRDNSIDVLIRGAGVAACCCVRLLREPGVRLKVEAVERPKQPAIMLSETTQKLLQDVFGKSHLFEGFLEFARAL